MKCDELKKQKYCQKLAFGDEVYLAKIVDPAIAELKDKCQMHDFFWEGSGFAKRGFKNTIAVSEAFDRLEAENAELKAKLEDAKASHYAESVDAGMRERRLRRALWLARAERNKALAAIVHCQGAWHDTLDTKRSGKFWNKGGKLLNASKKCRAKAEKFKEEK